ncbi:TraV family lipoprotein [uncultured Umboniibacter sp.]|uniref:TraV family lipoprotein n=1 Tax=uncultured Umboniibacter sp. TaxID=1798917 RepID=UPI00260171FD|nr:TraV family lipoprotein [uncultured Umboniibacter sp.]
MTKYLTALAATLMISGCANTYDEEFSCPYQNEAHCTGVRDMYSATNGGQRPSAELKQTTDTTQHNARDAKDDVVESTPNPVELPRIASDPVIDNFVTPMMPDRPVPVRTPSVVMRIRVFAYEEARSGALVSPGYIFTEIVPRTWVLGNPDAAVATRRVFSPLQTNSGE